eukprot:c20069_g1_i1 orf=227-2725(+)
MRFRLPGLSLHRGCSIDWLSSASNQSFLRQFSSTAFRWASLSTWEWCDVFEGIFEQSPSLSKKLSERQSAESATFLLNVFEKTVQSKAERQEAFKGQKLQLSEDGLLQVFRHLIKGLNVDHAVRLCTKLPAKHLKTGIDTLIRVLLERIREDDVEITYQGELADKIFELLKHLQGKGCTPSEGTSQSLLKWLLDNGDASRSQKFLQLLQEQSSNMSKALECPESMDLSQAEHSKNKMGYDLWKESDDVDHSLFLATNFRTLSAKEISKLLDKIDVTRITCNRRLFALFHCFGKLGLNEESIDNLVRLQREGKSKGHLKIFIASHAKGLTEICPKSRDIKRDVEGFKKINTLLNLSTDASFNMLIAHCANHGEIDLCIDLIQTMKVNGVEPSPITYEPLIKYFARTFEISKAEDILQVMRIGGMCATVKSYKYLIAAHTRANNLEKAYNLIEEISLEELTPDLYSTIIHAHGMKGQVSLALLVFQQMRKKNVKPNAESFETLIRACAIRKDLKGAEKVFKLFKKQGDFDVEDHKGIVAAMLRVYASSGNNEQIEKILHCSQANALVTQKAKSELLQGFAERGRTEEAINIYNDIRNRGGWPDSGAFLCLLYGLSNAGELNQLLALFEPFKKSVQTRNRVLQDELISHACCTIVHGLIHHNNLERAVKFLQKVQQEKAGDVETLCLKVFTEDKCETTSVQHVHLALKDKLKFLEAMRKMLKVQPTRLAYESLLESCAREKNAHCADLVLHMMNDDNFQFNVFTYLILLKIVVSRRDLESIKLLLSEMRQAVENSGLQDDHVKLVVREIMRSANFDSLVYCNLMTILYPSMQSFI